MCRVNACTRPQAATLCTAGMGAPAPIVVEQTPSMSSRDGGSDGPLLGNATSAAAGSGAGGGGRRGRSNSAALGGAAVVLGEFSVEDRNRRAIQNLRIKDQVKNLMSLCVHPKLVLPMMWVNVLTLTIVVMPLVTVSMTNLAAVGTSGECSVVHWASGVCCWLDLRNGGANRAGTAGAAGARATANFFGPAHTS